MTERLVQGRKLGAWVVLLVMLMLPANAFAAEFDVDNRSDLTIFRQTSTLTPGTWFLSLSNINVTLALQWGLSGDFPVPGTYTGGAANDLGVWRPTDGVWYIRHYTSDTLFSAASAFQFGGLSGDAPYPCDVNGDGRTDLNIFRSSTATWFTALSDAATASNNYKAAQSQQWGLSSDTPIPWDYDMDGKCDYAVFRDGLWLILLTTFNNNLAATVAWGADGDVPVPGRYDNDSITDFAVYRAGASEGPLWLIRRSTTLLALNPTRVVQWGLAGDIPVTLDVDADTFTDIAVYRPSTGTWFILTSGSNYATALSFQFGLPGSDDIPVGDRRGSDPS